MNPETTNFTDNVSPMPTTEPSSPTVHTETKQETVPVETKQETIPVTVKSQKETWSDKCSSWFTKKTLYGTLGVLSVVGMGVLAKKKLRK